LIRNNDTEFAPFGVIISVAKATFGDIAEVLTGKSAEYSYKNPRIKNVIFEITNAHPGAFQLALFKSSKVTGWLVLRSCSSSIVLHRSTVGHPSQRQSIADERSYFDIWLEDEIRRIEEHEVHNHQKREHYYHSCLQERVCPFAQAPATRLQGGVLLPIRSIDHPVQRMQKA
jgi:hypothetical protein